jgi:hypothetical protein
VQPGGASIGVIPGAPQETPARPGVAKERTMAPTFLAQALLRRATRWLLGALFLLAAAAPAAAALATDAIVFTNRSSSASSIASPRFSTASGGQLLLAFVATDARSAGITVTGVNGAALTWVLVRRTNGQLGTAEVWRAFAATPLSGVTVRANLSQSVAASITVVGFTGADASGGNGAGAIGATAGASASTGAPGASLVTTRDNSWVFGVGNDYDRAIARGVPADQRLVNQYLATVGDTYWVQRQGAPTAAAGTAVAINDTGPTNDRYNLSIVEVRAAPPAGGTYSVSGSIAPASIGAGAAVTLSQGGTAIAAATVDAGGAYRFSGIANGSYTVTPSKAGVSFSPATQSVTVSGAPATVGAFTAAAASYAVSGSLTPSSLGAAATVTLSQGTLTIATATANSSGSYSFPSVINGSYTVTPGKTGVVFSPLSRSITVSGGPVTVAAFTAAAVGGFTVSGSVTPATLGAGASVRLSQSATTVATTTVTTSGTYSFAGVANGSYTVTPSKTGVTFSPTSRGVTVNGASATVAAFSATGPGSSNRPDLSVIVPNGRMSISGSGSTRMFNYTHDTFNGGSGPLVIQPEYHAASGNYLGTQYLYSFSGGTWTLAQQVPVAGAFIFHAVHGHFHFPFVTFGLYAVASDGGIGAPVVQSEKNGFCIADSFIYDSSLPNAGALGNLGSCSDPLSLRGLDIGAVDEYDRSDPGQSIPLANVPDGTYWLRAIVDPDNLLLESDESNNETDVRLTISGSTVTELETVTPVLPPPPSVALASPTDQATVSGTVTLAATPSAGTTVQYLLNGLALGSPVAAPFSMAWDTATVPDGISWLAAQATDPATGRTGTSAVARVNVANGGTRPPVVTVTSPEPDTTVSAITALAATAAGTAPIARVQFFVDNQPVGSPLTAPPYLFYWDSRTAGDGPHTLTAAATDTFSLTGTSAPVSFTVDNSRPPSTIGVDALAFSDAAGVMTTPAFSTTNPSDLLVAFVAYDGPSGAPQSASVSGAGLAWTLLMRSNAQSGTAEIWVARPGFVLGGASVTSQPTVAGYHGSLVVIAFSNAAGTGVVGRTSAPSGAPDIFLPGISAGNWVFAVGNDWDQAIGRTPVAGQVLVHQRVDSSVGDTFWVQSTAAPSTANALVDIHDSAPTTDQWNFAAVEIVATRP